MAAAAAEAAQAQVIALTQSGEELTLPEPVDLAFCRFVLLHVHDPLVVLRRMGQAVRPGGWVVTQEPITSAGRIDGRPFSMEHARHADIGALLPALVRRAGLELVDAWAEAPAWAGPGPVTEYLAALTEVDPGEDSDRPAAARDRGVPPAVLTGPTGGRLLGTLWPCPCRSGSERGRRRPRPGHRCRRSRRPPPGPVRVDGTASTPTR